MLKVTMENVTKMSEDALYIALDGLTPKDAMYPVIEAELDRRAALVQARLARQQESLLITQAIQVEIAAIFAGVRGVKTLMLIENFGQEFIEDYTIDEETFTVYSKVRHEIFHNPTSWECGSIEIARRKMAKLIYDRIYNKFMRDATADNLELLKRVIGG